MNKKLSAAGVFSMTEIIDRQIFEKKIITSTSTGEHILHYPALQRYILGFQALCNAVLSLFLACFLFQHDNIRKHGSNTHGLPFSKLNYFIFMELQLLYRFTLNASDALLVYFKQVFKPAHRNFSASQQQSQDFSLQELPLPSLHTYLDDVEQLIFRATVQAVI